jgi:hypothetical protein
MQWWQIKVNMNSNGSSLNDDIVENKFSNFGFIDSYDAKAYVFNSKTGTWVAQTFNTFASPTLVTSNGNCILLMHIAQNLMLLVIKQELG